MKLRLRSLASRETQRLEVPSSCTLHQLKQFLSQAISLSPSSLLRFSLNAKDELDAPSSDASLQSLGVTSGDLIYYSLNAAAFISAQDLHGEEPESLVQNQDKGNIQEPKAGEASVSRGNSFPDVGSANEGIPVTESLESIAMGVDSQEPVSKDLEFSQENQETPVVDHPNQGVAMDVDDGSAGRRMYEPFFLRRVLREELGDDASAHKLLAIVVQAVLLESGFVRVDLVSGEKVERFQLPDDRPSTILSMSLWYTLPELLNDNSNDNDVTESAIILKFQSLGNFINVYGCLSKGDSGCHRVCLNEYKFAPIIAFLRGKNDDNEDESGNLHQTEVFEFWKVVKDGLALPLLIDLCDRTGLNLPACLMCLPTELKLKILEFLPAVDIMRIECVSKEMRYLGSSDEVWKKRFEEDFGGDTDTCIVHNWKGKYRENMIMQLKIRQASSRVARPVFFPFYRGNRNPHRIPPTGGIGVIGGDYDRLPGLGIPSPFGQPSLAFPHYHRRRNFSPNCNWGGI